MGDGGTLAVCPALLLFSAVLGPPGKVPKGGGGRGAGGGSLLGLCQSFLRSRQEEAVDGEMSKG